MAIAKIEKQQVIGALKATGSRDQDVLFACKEKLLEETKKMKILGVAPIVIGTILTISIIGAIPGIPALAFGLFMRKRIRTNIETTENAFAEYLNSIGARAAAV